MTNTIKIKVPVTTATTAIITNNNEKEIREINLLGKYSVASAKKYFTQNKIENACSFVVMNVTKNVDVYEIELATLMETLNKHGVPVIFEPETISETSSEPETISETSSEPVTKKKKK